MRRPRAPHRAHPGQPNAPRPRGPRAGRTVPSGLRRGQPAAPRASGQRTPLLTARSQGPEKDGENLRRIEEFGIHKARPPVFSLTPCPETFSFLRLSLRAWALLGGLGCVGQSASRPAPPAGTAPYKSPPTPLLEGSVPSERGPGSTAGSSAHPLAAFFPGQNQASCTARAFLEDFPSQVF